MRFNSKSVLLNSGINQRYMVRLPKQLDQYQIADEVWEDAVKEFNKRLDRRPHVTVHMGDIKIDVLKIGRTMETIVLWLVVKKKDLPIINHTELMLHGEVIFAEDSDTKVDKMVIKDVVFGDKGIFVKKS